MDGMEEDSDQLGENEVKVTEYVNAMRPNLNSPYLHVELAWHLSIDCCSVVKIYRRWLGEVQPSNVLVLIGRAKYFVKFESARKGFIHTSTGSARFLWRRSCRLYMVYSLLSVVN